MHSLGAYSLNLLRITLPQQLPISGFLDSMDCLDIGLLRLLVGPPYLPGAQGCREEGDAAMQVFGFAVGRVAQDHRRGYIC